MSIFKNQSTEFIPVREQRRFTAAALNALNAELVATINGDNVAMINIRAAAAVTMTISFEGSIDGVNYVAMPTFPYAASIGTILNFAQPIISEAFAAVAPIRLYAMACAGFQLIRVRVSAFTSGSLACAINTGPESQLPLRYYDSPPASLALTVTAAAAAIATLTLPAVAGFRHILTSLAITRSPSALLVAAAAPVIVTTTNIPGALAFTFGADAAPIGNDKTVNLDCGGNGLACTAINTNTTVVGPATAGVIWRINATYRLGL